MAEEKRAEEPRREEPAAGSELASNYDDVVDSFDDMVIGARAARGGARAGGGASFLLRASAAPRPRRRAWRRLARAYGRRGR